MDLSQSPASSHPAWVDTIAHLDRMRAMAADGSLDEAVALGLGAADVLAAAVAVGGEAPEVAERMGEMATRLAVQRRQLLMMRLDLANMPDDLSGLDLDGRGD